MAIGHQKQIDYLYHRTKDRSAVGAYIFSGPAQIGKKLLRWNGCRIYFPKICAKILPI